MRQILAINPLERNAGGHLFALLLRHMADCAGEEDEIFAERQEAGGAWGTRDTAWKDESFPCTWCMGEGRFCGSVPCYFCDATGWRPTQRGFRLLRDAAGNNLSKHKHTVAETATHLARLRSMDEFEFQQFHDTINHENPFLKDTLQEQIEWAEGMIADITPAIEKGEWAVSAIDELIHVSKTVDRAVAYQFLHEEEAREERTQSVCADCGKVATAWDSDGTAYCKRHAHSRGLLRPDRVDPIPTPTPTRSVDDSGTQPQQRLRMTRPFRFIDGPLAGQAHPVPRGETTVVVEGHTYQRRGHHFEYAGE